MKKINYIFIVILCVFSFTGNSYGKLIASIDFEEGVCTVDVKSASPCSTINYSGEKATIVSTDNAIVPRSGKLMVKSYLNRKKSDTTYRAESTIINPFLPFDKGKVRWVGLSIYLPEDWDMNYVHDYSSGVVVQFHNQAYLDTSYRLVLPLAIHHSVKGWGIRNHTYPTYGPNAAKGIGDIIGFSEYAPFKIGEWNDFVIQMKLSGAKSNNDTDGFIKVWVNGNLELDVTGQNYFGEVPNGPMLKFGLYQWGWKEKYQENWVGPDYRTIYHDAIRIGDENSSYDEVLPNTDQKENKSIFPPADFMVN